jgi:hypothetical protein
MVDINSVVFKDQVDMQEWLMDYYTKCTKSRIVA